MGLGVQSSNADSKQNSGLLEGDKPGISSYAAGYAPQIGNSYSSFMNQPLPNFSTGKFGFGPQFDSAVTQLGSDLFNNASSTAGARGFLSPENLGAVTGSAIQNAAPQLASYANQAQQTQLFGPDQIMAQRYGTANNYLTTLAQLLGSNGNQSSSSFGFQAQGPSGGGGGGSAAMVA